MTITVIGGGLAGLVAAIECAERGADVELLEAHAVLGGRARTTTGGFAANHGPHVVYEDGPLWRWLDERGIAEPAGKPPLTGVRFRHRGAMRRTPPVALVRALPLLRREAPVDRSFRSWVADALGDDAAEVASRACHVFTFNDDPGALSAAFVAERARRAFTLPPIARYVVGGWGTLVDRLATRARSLGVRITLGARVVDLPEPPVVLALPLAAARRITGDESLRWHGARTVLVDVGLRTRRGDPFVVFDLEHGVFAERFSAPDRTLAPDGHQLVQAQVGLADGQELADGVATIEGLFDDALPAWREREVWRRLQLVTDSSGALDPPGTTWHDRPAVDRGDGVLLCGDMVAAPGLLGEVSWASAVEAAQLAVAMTPTRATPARSRAGSPSRSTVA